LPLRIGAQLRLLSAGSVFVQASAIGQPDPVASYHLTARLDTQSHSISATGSIRFVNESNAALKELWFHLYPNAFVGERTRFLRIANASRRSNRSWLSSPGGLEVIRLAIEGQNSTNIWLGADTTTPGDPDDATDRRVPLPEPLQPGETLNLQLQFVTNLPTIVERMGWVEDFHAVTQWYPKLARLEKDGTWRHFPYEPLAEFYADFGDYDISIDTPENFVVAAPGERMVLAREHGRVVRRFQLENAHDFAWFAWPQFVESNREVQGVRVQMFAPPGHSTNAMEELNTLAFGLAHFQKLFGPYPYRQLTVVHPPDVAAPAGGMEYPGLIVTGGPWYLPWSGLRSLSAVALHELAHQWFYGMIANDEVRFPVLDEGLSTWAELDGLSSMFGQGSAFSGFGVTVSATAIAAEVATSEYEAGPLARPATEFSSFSALAATVYARTATLLDTFDHVYGSAELRRALFRYAMSERYSHPTPDSLVKAFQSEMGLAAARNLSTALYSNGWVDYSATNLSARQVAQNRWTSAARLNRRGTLSFPVQVSLTLETGQVLHQTWGAADSELDLEIAADAPVSNVVIDPENRVSIETNRLNNAVWRVPPPKPFALLERLLFVVDWLLVAVMP
jgi:hypothetical protein